MNFVNNTQHPALNFEGIDTLEQEFHVVVVRQTYTWNDQGLLILADEQDPLCMADELVNPQDIMSGVIEESDLCHYKPKCDILIKGHAYTPAYLAHSDHFNASLRIQTPDKILFNRPIKAGEHNTHHPHLIRSNKDYTPVKGDVLVNKTLAIYSPRNAVAETQGIMGNPRYRIKTQSLSAKVSLNPSSSFGGYSIIEQTNPAIDNIKPEHLIPEAERDAIRLNPKHGVIAYFAQDAYNPAGTGSHSPLYHQHIRPKQFKLPQIHLPEKPLDEITLNSSVKAPLKDKQYRTLVAGFGIMAKSHPERHQWLGDISPEFIQNSDGSELPEGFDFAIWNCAYPDQRVTHMVGNEWITLTNLCHPNTLSATKNRQGDTELTLYLPETLAYLLTNSNRPDLSESEVPMKLDTVIISPDQHKVHLVWRGIIAAEYDPKTIFLETADRAKQQAVIRGYFTQKGDIVRPYERGGQP